MGKMTEPAFAGSSSLPLLERLCELCNGNGKIASQRRGTVLYSGHRCNDCQGTGSVLTDQGRLLLAFLERHRR